MLRLPESRFAPQRLAFRLAFPAANAACWRDANLALINSFRFEKYCGLSWGILVVLPICIGLGAIELTESLGSLVGEAI